MGLCCVGVVHAGGGRGSSCGEWSGENRMSKRDAAKNTTRLATRQNEHLLLRLGRMRKRRRAREYVCKQCKR